MICALLLALVVSDVRPLTTAQLCAIHWRTDRRHVTIGMKRIVAAKVGIPEAAWPQYEFDHIVPRQLGGADVVENLQLQCCGATRPGPAHDKDVAENRLTRRVCAGTITLRVAQQQMRTWTP
jgi:hypothetical protein